MTMPQPRLDSRPRPGPGASLVTVDGRSYPLRAATLTARAEGGLALTLLAQEFHNPHAEPLEVLYTLPLPADGAVVGYTVQIGERVIRGEIEKREAASKAYARALAEGRTAGLLEQDRDDTFTQRLGSIPPGIDVRVEIAVLQPLDFVPAEGPDAARWEYRFPTVVGVRYEGEPGRVPDAGRLDVDRVDREGEGEIPARIELALTVADGSPAALAVASTTHDIRCTEESGLARVSLRSGARLDRDLVVRWKAGAERVGVRLVEGPGLPGDDGRYALLTLTPPAVATSGLARDLTVLLDASGSMSGEPLRRAKQVVTALLRSLEPGDRFELIAFADASRSLTGGLREATPKQRDKTIRALEALTAGGGTEMAGALVRAIQPLRGDSQRQVVLVTDGYIGFESQVIGEILRRLPANARVHTVGVGAAPSRATTHAVARAGRGVEVLAGDEAAAAEAARRLCRATVRPVLTELSIGGDGLRGWAPQRPRDVLGGQPLVMALELKPRGGTVELGAREAGTDEAWIWRIVVPPIPDVTAGNESPSPVAPPDASSAAMAPLPIGALYGREVIADLELEVAARAPSPGDDGLDGAARDLDALIEQAGLRHRIASRRTSLVAVADEPSVDPKLPRRRERVAVEMPAGLSAEGSGLVMRSQAVLGWGGMGMVSLLGRLMEEPKGPVSGRGPARLEQSLRRFEGTFDGAELKEARATAWPAWAAPAQVSIDGRALHVAPEAITVEFQVPFDGFVLPDGEVNLWLEGTTWLIASVIGQESSPRGPHKAGLVVRLALSIKGHPEWLGARSVDLRWLSRPEGASGDDAPRQIVLSVPTPQETAGPR
jgi:Ca-activated chloride channel family protein